MLLLTQRVFIHQETINLVSEKNIYVRVLAGIDLVTREARWEFQSLDPETGTILLVVTQHSTLESSCLGDPRRRPIYKCRTTENP